MREGSPDFRLHQLRPGYNNNGWLLGGSLLIYLMLILFFPSFPCYVSAWTATGTRRAWVRFLVHAGGSGPRERARGFPFCGLHLAMTSRGRKAGDRAEKAGAANSTGSPSHRLGSASPSFIKSGLNHHHRRPNLHTTGGLPVSFYSPPWSRNLGNPNCACRRR